MRRNVGELTSVLWLAILVMSASLMCAAEPQRTITVSAMAEVEAVPDQVVLSLEVSTEDVKSLSDAKAENDRRTKLILALTRKHRIPEKQVKIASFTMGPSFDPFEKKRTVIGYRVDRRIDITLQDVGALDSILGEALEAGMTEVHHVLFQTTKHREHQVEARQRAVAYAKEKASHLAELNGLRLGKAITIEEGVEGDRHTRGYGMAMGGMAMSSSQNMTSPGQTKIRLVDDPAVDKSAPAAKDAAPSSQMIPPGILVIDANVTITYELLDVR